MLDSSDPHSSRQDVVRSEVAEALVSALKHANAHAAYCVKRDELYAAIDAECDEAFPEIEGDGAEERQERRRSFRLRHRRHAREELESDHTLEPKSLSLAIKAGTGVGKTHGALQAFLDLEPGAVDFYLPTVDMCVEIENQWPDDRIMMERPRNGMDPNYMIPGNLADGEVSENEENAREQGWRGRMCGRYRKAEALADAGLSVPDMLCRRCSIKEHCGYLKQKTRISEHREAGGLTLRTHARLYLGRPTEGAARTAIIDESIVSSSAKDVAFKRDDMAVHKLIRLFDNHAERTEIEDGLRALIEITDDVGAERYRPVPEVVGNIDRLKNLAAFIREEISNRASQVPALDMSVAELQDAIRKHEFKTLGKLKTITNMAIKAGNQGVALRAMHADDKNAALKYIQSPNSLEAQDNLILLDASYRSHYADILFPKRTFDVRAFDANLNVKIFQDVYAPSTAQALQDGEDDDATELGKKGYGRANVMRAAVKWIGEDQRALLLAKDGVMKLFKKDGMPPGWDTTTFGKAQGSNEWTDFDAVAIVGQACPAAEVFEREAAAWRLEAGDTRSIITVADYYEENPSEKGKGRTLLPLDAEGFYRHPDPEVQRLYDAKVGDIFVQAVGRVRANLQTEPKKVYFASKFRVAEFEDYIVNPAAGEAIKLNAWQEYLALALMRDGFVLRSPITAVESFGLDQRSIDISFHHASVADDAELCALMVKRNFQGLTSKMSNKLLVENEINSNLGPQSSWAHSLGGFSLGNAPKNSIFVSQVHLKGKGRSTTMFHGEHVDPEHIRMSVPGLEFAKPDDERANRLQLLQAAGFTLSKRFEVLPSGAYRSVTKDRVVLPIWFKSYEGKPVDGIEALAGQLEDLRHHRECMVIRGRKAATISGQDTKRRMTRKESDVPYIVDAPRQWIMFDVDKFQIPGGLTIDDLGERGAAETMVRSLPEPWRSTTCYVHASSSCGMKGRRMFKGHVWFWLDKPLNSTQAKQMAKQHLGQKDQTEGAVIDAAVFVANHPHFTADPDIDGPQPLDERSWLIRGERDVIEVPEIVEVQRREVTVKPSSKASSGRDPWGKFDWALQDIGDDRKGFYEPLKGSVAQAAVDLIDSGEDRTVVVSRISDRVYEAEPGDRSEDEIDRYADPYYVDAKIENIIEWRTNQNNVDDVVS